MKKIIFFTMLLILSATSFSQQTNPSKPVTRADYLLKSKNQKIGAWILLGSGAVIFAIVAPGNVSFDALGPLVVVGTLATLGSIPLFIASGRNKRKGMRLSFKNETTPQIQKSSIVYRYVPSITIKISL